MKWKYRNLSKRPRHKEEEVGGQPISWILMKRKERKVLLLMLVEPISKLIKEGLLFLTAPDTRITSKI
jgi:hypothetical protein